MHDIDWLEPKMIDWLIQDQVDGLVGKERLRRSYSVPPRSQDVVVRKLKYMGQKSSEVA